MSRCSCTSACYCWEGRSAVAVEVPVIAGKRGHQEDVPL